ncbi:thioesterase domain-containing protein [Nocardioides sp. NPDC000445]|uniref:thioesterase II family protein n=1 Tax=Nocardioides sp. NPDC000445 TaxID=3154257 RepID=UPI003325F592
MQARFLHEIPGGRAGTTVVVFPPAGRGAYSFVGRLSSPHRAMAVVLPGRERRLGEPLASRISQLIDPLCDELETLAARGRLLLQGHSLGAYIAHAATKELQGRGVQVDGLGVAAAEAPVQPPALVRHELDDESFAAAISVLGGTPPEVFAEPSLRAMFLPLLRADFALAETYAPDPEPVSCPISASYGLEDADVDPEGVKRWVELTTGPFEVTGYRGDHFFPDQHLNDLCANLDDLAAGGPPRDRSARTPESAQAHRLE